MSRDTRTPARPGLKPEVVDSTDESQQDSAAGKFVLQGQLSLRADSQLFHHPFHPRVTGAIVRKRPRSNQLL